ncbi:hypothetical protein [Kingella potus]|uniref:hypothetical protein n=1 Tax=Kingella potus TaxID=265175 RepID=UPI001FD2DB54|nr:hypothetical protein [Kingella potus]UOP01778.1 hypothetical protein LVJ84_06645 [Kingella potus]
MRPSEKRLPKAVIPSPRKRRRGSGLQAAFGIFRRPQTHPKTHCTPPFSDSLPKQGRPKHR